MNRISCLLSTARNTVFPVRDMPLGIASHIDIEIEVVYVTDLRQFEVPFVADLSGSLGLQPFQAVMKNLGN